MPRKLFAAISQIVLGALIAIAPQTFEHVCVPSKTCPWHAATPLGSLWDWVSSSHCWQ